ncbi:MAG: proteasome assembly chaperone family protein [Thermoplasmata archaeon]|nr:MAG: proteasome assembly chaperone family protein [Thermoplasmata archaeon]
MEDDIQIHMYEEVDLNNAMLIDGFPTVGLLSTIVSSFIVDALKLRRVGAVISRHFPAAAIIQNGVPSPPLRIYAGPKLCGPENECDQVVVLNSEVRIPDDLQLPLAQKILDWAKAEGIKTILTVEGTPMQDVPDPEDTVGIYGAGSTERARELIKRFNLTAMDMGIITGVSGQMLYLANMEARDVLCLLGPAHSQYPDARAAAKMIEVIDDMLPVIEIDTDPLLEQAAKIEQEVQGALEAIQRSMEHGQEPQSLPGPMYR